MSRLGLSVDEFEDLTPYELDVAFRDHEKYHFHYAKEHMYLTRQIGTILRNKGLIQSAQYRDPRKLFRFSFEQAKEVHHPTEQEWQLLDKRYTRPGKN